ncbi:unnamed protein product [Plutella xylostella]|uniref:(diamondback moth) hypothetical protein n=1 Tax=Plutella xylostella TaxID=51655 RepID=A0A8S4FAM4_PLUXY|nr:unnamed protein product [Plutella xylostella]
MMLNIKLPIIKKDIEATYHSFERVYDKKHYYITHVLKLINVADDQFQRTVASYCDTVDAMINKFLSDLEEMSKENGRKTAELLKYTEDDFADISTKHDGAETHLHLLIYHSHTVADNLAWTTRGEFLVKEDDDRMGFTNIRESLCSFLENTYNLMWEDYKAVLREYVANTSENQKKGRRLRQKENMMADIIAKQAKRIADDDNILRRLRNELQAYESGTKQAAYRDRRNRYRTAWNKMKQNLITSSELDFQQMEALVHEANSASEFLNKSLQKADKILRMAALCRRLETLREKVLPFGSDQPQTDTDVENINGRSEYVDPLVLNAISNTSGLARLWHRISRAELTRRALHREKLLLQQENDDILLQIETYRAAKNTVGCPLTCISVNPNKGDMSKPVADDGDMAVSKYNIKFM